MISITTIAGGGSGGSQNLEEVLTVGNNADIPVIIQNLAGDTTKVDTTLISMADVAGNLLGIAADDINMVDTTGELATDISPGNVVVGDLTSGASLAMADDGSGGVETLYRDGSGNTVKQIFDTITGNWVQVYPNGGGLIQISGYGMQYPTVQVSADTTATREMYAIAVDTISGDVNIFFDSTFGAGVIYTVKKIAGIHNVKLSGTGCTFDGAANATISVLNAVLTVIYFGGGKYYIF